MIGVASATHALVLWGIVAVCVLVAIAIHAHYQHTKTRSMLNSIGDEAESPIDQRAINDALREEFIKGGPT